MKKLAAIIFILLLMTFGFLGCSNFTKLAIQRQAKKAVDYSYMQDDKMHIFLCGTGSPVPDPNHLEPCVAIVVSGQILLVDTGNGAIDRVRSLKLPLNLITKVFITHFHSDHIGGLGEVINTSWIFGRAQAIDIYGPQGIHKVVKGFNLAYSFDADYRAKHHGNDMKLKDRKVNISSFNFENSNEAVTIYKGDDLIVSTFLVDHAPAQPAVGYRFEYKGKILVISGDTVMNKTVERYSKDADMLIHSAMHKGLNRMVAETLQEIDGKPMQRAGRMLEDTLNYQTDTTELGKLAQRSGVRRLVLTHLVPPPRYFFMRRAFKKSVSEFYKGELILGEDYMHLEID